MPDCLFCKIIAGDIPSDKVYEDDSVFAFRDISPQAPTHILIVPKKHVAKLSDAADEDADVLGHIPLVAKKLAAELGHSDWRLVVNNGEGAGQSVFHIHYHLLAGRPLSWPPG